MAGEIITDAGLNELAKLLAGQGTPFAYIALGTGTTGPSASDTALENEVIRKPASASVSGNKVTFKAIINPGDLVGVNITEIGLFNAPSGGTLYYRKVRDHPLYFDADVGAEIVVECSFSR